MKLLRIFPRKTNATPIDENVIINRMPNLFDEADQIHISVAFSWDIPIAEKLYKEWYFVAPIKIGGPAFNEPGDEFEPGMYLKQGYTITSRGCQNKCWFCSVWKREPELKELQIKDGWNVLDDNLLQCSENHIRKVFEMLKRQNHKPRFTGGLEANLLTEERAKQLKELRPEALYFAYDTPNDLDSLINAGSILKNVGFGKSHDMMCYVLIGYPNDTIEKAKKRIAQTVYAGFMPFAMRYRDEKGLVLKERKWNLFQREWTNPIICAANCKKLKN